MLQFLSLKPEVFGLDISDSSLKIIKIKRKGKKFFLTSFLEEKIEPDLIEMGEINSEEKLAEILKQSIKKVRGEKLKTNYVIASLPEEKAFLQVIKMPPMSEEDLKSAIIFEAENYIPLPIGQVYLDSQIISSLDPSSKEIEVAIVAIPKKIVDSYLSTMKKAKLRPLAFEIESQAIVRALIENENIPYPVSIVDLGATRTSLIIFAKNSIRFTCSISVSGNHFTQLIAKALKINFSEAEQLKKKYGLELKGKSEKEKIFEALIPGLVDLTQQIRKYLDFFETHSFNSELANEERRIKKIILCGGGANLSGLPEFLSLELKREVELGNPLKKVSLKNKKINLPFEESLKFTTAIGLAQREL